MRVLHTSDWHLGHRLYGRRREEEQGAFLDWLIGILTREAVDVLIVAGDIFDTTTPSNRAQELYYRFLYQVLQSPCRQVVIIAGNHDSPRFLEAPKALLTSLAIQVIGQPTQDPREEVLVLEDRQGTPGLIVCAVPYLRESDLRTVAVGESVEDKAKKLLDGLVQHYAAVVRAAEARRTALGLRIPLIATGHLFAAGGQITEGDGVRDLYIGSLVQVDARLFPPGLDYLALGHLHSPQRVAQRETIRYSGAPLCMSFSEVNRSKSLSLVDFSGGAPAIREIPVPRFQRLERIQGDWHQIATALDALAREEAAAWLEVQYRGQAVLGDLRERVQARVQGTPLEVLRITDTRIRHRALGPDDERETLADLSPEEVFERCLERHEIPGEQRPSLRTAYGAILRSLREDDTEAD